MENGLAKMWVALIAIGLMFVAVTTILLSRTKLRGVLKYIISVVAYACMILAGFLIVLVVLSGPTK
ncbi:hypothetical protein A374_03379 [Fictibacillus macauensis ZFHKF-1]|uniref:DUF2768 domain-containing protein n=1 Tax=Fictibacillus macauensis ZFHKF-1 TaxID=1196324 RepID=I8UI61_9BACL|nr:DUF2768 domain-containing protein [Fictibacillus macauensis]EIT86580.1 hypothetical protein A374_03379 [Fictibacillus macauensis ZFHKF-1]